MYQDYFSLDDIMTLNERVPCKVQLPIHNFGHLDPSQGSPHLGAGSKLDLPLWMAHSLYSRHIVKIDTPKVYRTSFREILDADATVVNLHKFGPYFYEFGMYLLQVLHRETDDIAHTLIQSFKNRFRKIMDCAQNFDTEELCSWTQNLDKTEAELFQTGQKALMDFQAWQARKMDKVATSTAVVNHKKRKRAAMEDD